MITTLRPLTFASMDPPPIDPDPPVPFLACPGAAPMIPALFPLEASPSLAAALDADSFFLTFLSLAYFACSMSSSSVREDGNCRNTMMGSTGSVHPWW